MNKLAIFAVLIIALSYIVQSARVDTVDSLRARLAVRRNKLKASEQAPQVPSQQAPVSVSSPVPLDQGVLQTEASAPVKGAESVVNAAFVESKSSESSATVSKEAATVGDTPYDTHQNLPHSVTPLDEYDAMLEARIKSSIDAFTNAVNQVNHISELPQRTDVRPLAESMSKIQIIQDAVEAAMKAKDDFDAKQSAKVEANVARLMEIVREESARLHKAEDEYKASIQPVIDQAQQSLAKGENTLDQALKNAAASLGLSIASLGSSATTVSTALSTVTEAMQDYLEKAVRANIAMNNPELATLMGIPQVSDPSTRLPPPPVSNSNDVSGSFSSSLESASSVQFNDLINLFGKALNGPRHPPSLRHLRLKPSDQ